MGLQNEKENAGGSGGINSKPFVKDSHPHAHTVSSDKNSVSPISFPAEQACASFLVTNDGLAEKKPDPERAPEEPERGQWSNQMEFLLSCIAMSVGLGNIWRFPFTAYENGGGAFLIPYLIVLIFVGRPIYFLELCVGQFCSMSQIKIWRLNPLFRGVGYGAMIATITAITYYCSIMALTVFYFVVSFRGTLPWADCDEKWAGQGTCTSLNRTNLPELYFNNEVLKQADDINNGIGMPEWRLTLCLMFSWVVICLSLIKGVKSSGKVAYFTAVFPYVVLFTLLIRAVTLEGAGKGIEYLFKPDWSKLYDPNVWYTAVSQCFYSLNTGFGSVIMFSSYNPFKHNIYRDSWILSFMDTFTGLLAGITIFAILGSLAHKLGDIPIDEVVKDGSGLAFISYPDAIAHMGWAPQLFAALFFIMLFTLGIGSITADAGAIISIFCDQFPTLVRWKVTVVLCVSSFLIGLIYVTPGGQYIQMLVDYFGASFVIFTTSTLEVIGICWIYGLNNFIRDIEFMLSMKIGIYWKLCWGVIIPVGLTVILVYSLVTDEGLTYNNQSFPTSALVAGWLIAVVALAPIPIFAILAIRNSKAPTLFEKIREASQPSVKWGPADPKIRAEWEAYKRNTTKTTCHNPHYTAPLVKVPSTERLLLGVPTTGRPYD